MLIKVRIIVIRLLQTFKNNNEPVTYNFSNSWITFITVTNLLSERDSLLEELFLTRILSYTQIGILNLFQGWRVQCGCQRSRGDFIQQLEKEAARSIQEFIRLRMTRIEFNTVLHAGSPLMNLSFIKVVITCPSSFKIQDWRLFC